MVVFIVVLFCVIVALGFGLASAWSDFNGLIISNIYPLGVLVSFIPAYLVVTYGAPEVVFFASLKSHAISFGVMFFITFILFSMNWIGAGDSKLTTAFSLWTGVQGLPAFLFFMTAFGGLLGVVALILKRWKPVKSPKEGGWIQKVQAGQSAVPYGIAIAFGAIVAFYQVGYLDPVNLTDFGQATLGTSPSSFINK